MLQPLQRFSAFVLMAFCAMSYAKEADTTFQVEEITTFSGIPWGMTQLDADNLLVTIKSGELYRVNITSGERSLINGLPDIAVFGQGGLLDVSLSPDYAETGWVYFTYSHPTKEGATTALARAKISENTLTDWQDLLISDASSHRGQHFGSRIAFDNDGHVFFSIGDRGDRANAQDLTNHAGKILRLDLDGSVPGDNPYVRRGNVRPEIWSYGHRNPQGLFFDPRTKRLWSNEHGPRGGDEINLIRVGANYGWPISSYGKEYYAPIQVGEEGPMDGVEEPKKVFIPSIAPSALLIYQGEMFDDWNGDFLSTALALRHLNNVRLKSGQVYETRFLEYLNERMRDVIQAQDGALIISTDSGKLLRVTPK